MRSSQEDDRVMELFGYGERQWESSRLCACKQDGNQTDSEGKMESTRKKSVRRPNQANMSCAYPPPDACHRPPTLNRTPGRRPLDMCEPAARAPADCSLPSS